MGIAFGVIVVFGLLIFVMLVGTIVYLSRLYKVGPNQVMVISGREHKDPQTGEVLSYRIVKGGRAFVYPFLERVDWLSLEIMTIEVAVDNVYTIQGVPVSLEGVAQIKIASDNVSIRTAAERFLSKQRAEIINIAHETLAGHLRAICGTLTVEEIYRERDKFAQEVADVSATDLANMGLGIDSFVIKDIRDKEGYLEALGRPRIAEVKRDAVIAEQLAQTREEEARRDFGIKQAGYDAEVKRVRADADLAYSLQEAITRQKVREQEVEIEVVEKRKQIEVQEQETLRKEQELNATVRRPAEAEQFRIQRIADARRYEIEAEAQGQAEAERAQGLAEAEVIKAQGLATADAMQQKAEAWQNYSQAALIEQLIVALPEIVAQIAKPLAQTERIVVISNGENGTGTGASKVAADVSNIVAQVPATLEALTGLDILKAIQNLPGNLNQPAVNHSPEEPAKTA
ncbi:MAG: flotillin family protein [Anaerolineae bacterium]|nr:flotillin family protein [Anaerolineae bacterium]